MLLAPVLTMTECSPLGCQIVGHRQNFQMVFWKRCLEYLLDANLIYYRVQQEAGTYNLCPRSNSRISYSCLFRIQAFRWDELPCLRIKLANANPFTSGLLFIFIPKGNTFINIGHTIFLVLCIHKISHVLTPYMVIIITMFRAKVEGCFLYYLQY